MFHLNESILIPLALSLLAGMATVLGAMAVFFTHSKNERLLALALSFASGVMISVSLCDLLPHAQAILGQYTTGARAFALSLFFLLAGSLVTFLLDNAIPQEPLRRGGVSDKGLFRVGFISMLTIMLHNFPEGIATFVAGYDNLELGFHVALAITLHNIPEGISVSMPLYFAAGRRGTALRYAFLCALSEPVGALIAFLLLRPFITPFFLGAIFASVSGIMLTIAFMELIPAAMRYNHGWLAVSGMAAGLILMPLGSLLYGV